MTTAIAPRAPRTCPIADAIRSGVVLILKREAEIGQTIYAPGPNWTPLAGAHALEALKVAAIEPTHILAHDGSGAVWVIWR